MKLGSSAGGGGSGAAFFTGAGTGAGAAAGGVSIFGASALAGSAGGGLGIGAGVSDYGQQAIVAHVDTARFHDYTAFERFTPDGPVAVLPIGEGRSAIVWTLTPDAARRALKLDDRTFLAELQSAFGLRLGRFTRVGRRQAYPLSLTRRADLLELELPEPNLSWYGVCHDAGQTN